MELLLLMFSGFWGTGVGMGLHGKIAVLVGPDCEGGEVDHPRPVHYCFIPARVAKQGSRLIMALRRLFSSSYRRLLDYRAVQEFISMIDRESPGGSRGPDSHPLCRKRHVSSRDFAAEQAVVLG